MWFTIEECPMNYIFKIPFFPEGKFAIAANTDFLVNFASVKLTYIAFTRNHLPINRTCNTKGHAQNNTYPAWVLLPFVVNLATGGNSHVCRGSTFLAYISMSYTFFRILLTRLSVWDELAQICKYEGKSSWGISISELLLLVQWGPVAARCDQMASIS